MSHQKKVRILSIDGGGIRGIIPAYVIRYVEEYLQNKAPGTTLADHFDFLSGTSTGGILTGLYLAPQDEHSNKAKYTTEDALNFYLKEGYNIFNGSKIASWKRLLGIANATAYDPSHLERLLHEKFGNTLMSQMIKPCLITTYNMDKKTSFFFTSKEDTSKKEFFVRDVLRSTAAAPTYFPPAKIRNLAIKEDHLAHMMNIDGGVFANNPAMCAYAEARNTHFPDRSNREPTARDMQMLSIGTGGGGFKIEGQWKSYKWGLLKWAKLIPDIMMDGSIDTIAYQMNEIYESLEADSMGSYMRVDTPLAHRTYSTDMSDASDQNLNALLDAGEQTLKAAKEQGLDRFLDDLLD